MAFSDDFIQRVRESVDIVDEISLVVDLKKAGKNHFACCPFHDENTPSFSVDAEKQVYFCHGACGEGGDVFNFVMKHHSVEFGEAIKILAQRAGVPLEDDRSVQDKQKGALRSAVYGVLNQASDYYQENVEGQAEVKAFYERRGLSPEIQKTFALGAAENNWRGVIDTVGSEKHFRALVDSGLAVYKPKTATEKGKFYDRFRSAPIFPIRDDRGRVVSFAMRRLNDNPGSNGKAAKYINGPETEVFKKSAVAYGLYEALEANKNPSSLVVTEGYMDVIAAHQFGEPNTVATMGVAIRTPLAEKLYKHTDQLIFCFDGDNAGKSAATRALNSVLPLLDDSRRASFVMMPKGTDPDSMIREQGIEAYTNHLKLNAIPASDFILRTAQRDIPSLDTSEARGQVFANAKALLDHMPPSVTKSHILKRLEAVTATRPTEYMPFSFELQEGHCNGVDLPALESEVRAFIAQKIGVTSADIKVNWSMPELGPHRSPRAIKVGDQNTQKEIGLRMKEVGRILSLETPVSQGLTLKQLITSAKTSTGEHQAMAKALLSRYLRDTPAFETECQLASSHMGVIEESLKAVAPNMDEKATGQVSRWLSSVKTNAVNLGAALETLEPMTAQRIERHIEAISNQADQTAASLAFQEGAELDQIAAQRVAR